MKKKTSNEVGQNKKKRLAKDARGRGPQGAGALGPHRNDRKIEKVRM
jgi:hypothetical protein